MDIVDIATLTGDIGVPCIMVIILTYICIKLGTAGIQEFDSLRASLDSNTKALADLSTKIDGMLDGQ